MDEGRQACSGQRRVQPDGHVDQRVDLRAPLCGTGGSGDMLARLIQANAGFSPGDAWHAAPYAYVSLAREAVAGDPFFAAGAFPGTL